MNIKKHIKLILIVALVSLCLGLYFFNFQESFTENFNATSCTQFTNCSDCVNGKVIDTSSPCYWSSKKNKCGSFEDTGYSRLCDITPTPTPTPIPTPVNPTPASCPVCKECPELTLLRYPTFITKQ